MAIADDLGPAPPEVREQLKRYEFNLAFWGQFGIVFSALFVVAVKVLHYAYGEGLWNLPAPILGYSAAELRQILAIANIVLDGAATAALLSITVAVVLRIDIYKVVDRIINAPPTLLNPETVDRLAKIREGELTDKIVDLQQQLNDAQQRLRDSEVRRDELQKRLDGDRGIFDMLASALSRAAEEAKNAGTKP